MDGSSAHRRSLQVETMGLGRVYRARPSRTLSVKCRARPSGLLELRIRCSARKKARATLELVSIIQLYTMYTAVITVGMVNFQNHTHDTTSIPACVP